MKNAYGRKVVNISIFHPSHVARSTLKEKFYGVTKIAQVKHREFSLL